MTDDKQTKNEFQSVLKRWREQGKTILVSVKDDKGYIRAKALGNKFMEVKP